MSAPLVIPFNHQPANTGAKASGTYTVPAGMYAWVTVFCRDSGSITLNGTAVVESMTLTQKTQQVAAIDLSASTTGASTSVYQCSNDNYFEGQCHLNASAGTANLLVGGEMVATVTAGNITIPLRMCTAQEATVTRTGSAGTATAYITGTEFDEFVTVDSTITTATASFWAKAGDAIAIVTQGNIVYSEYNVVS